MEPAGTEEDAERLRPGLTEAPRGCAQESEPTTSASGAKRWSSASGYAAPIDGDS